MEKQQYKQQQFFSLAVEVEKLKQKLNSQRFRIRTIKPRPKMSKWVPDKEIIEKLIKTQYNEKNHI